MNISSGVWNLLSVVAEQTRTMSMLAWIILHLSSMSMDGKELVSTLLRKRRITSLINLLCIGGTIIVAFMATEVITHCCMLKCERCQIDIY